MDKRRCDYLNEQECNPKYFLEIQTDRLGSNSVCPHFAFAFFLYVYISYYTFNLMFFIVLYWHLMKVWKKESVHNIVNKFTNRKRQSKIVSMSYASEQIIICQNTFK